MLFVLLKNYLSLDVTSVANSWMRVSNKWWITLEVVAGGLA